MTPAEFSDLLDSAYVKMRPWSETAIADALQTPGTVLIAEPGCGLLGRIITDEAEILAFATDPALQRRGLAARALAQFDTEAKNRGAATCFLEVAASNLPAIAFYRARGFATLGKRPAYYRLRDGSRDDAYVMTRSLA